MKIVYLVFLSLLFLAQPCLADSMVIDQVPQDMQRVPEATLLKESIMEQVGRCWVLPKIPDIQKMPKVVLNVLVGRDAKPTDVALDASGNDEFRNNANFRSLVMSAILAIKICSPLKNLPPEEFDTWHSLQLLFDPALIPPADAAAPATPH